jgi:UDP-glucose 4-epimerase
MKIAVTGSSGFIGRALCRTLAQSDRNVMRTSLSASAPGVEIMIHLAAKTPHSNSFSGLQAYEYDRVNARDTIKLAKDCAARGVKRFLFISSAKVLGAESDIAYSDSDPPFPRDAYAKSKLSAELGLRKIEAQTGMQVVILRPPLVYGPGVRGNLLKIVRIIRCGIPLPFAGIKNRRSLIGRENLVDLIIRCIDDPGVAGKTFLVSDGQDLSTPELLRIIATEMNCRLRLFPVPDSLLRLAGYATGRGPDIERLTGSFALDTENISKILAWSAPISIQAGIREMVQVKSAS